LHVGDDNDYDDRTVDDIPPAGNDDLFETVNVRVYSSTKRGWKPVQKTRRKSQILRADFRVSKAAIDEDLCFRYGTGFESIRKEIEEKKLFRGTVPHDLWREDPILDRELGEFRYCGCMLRTCRENAAASAHACGHCNRR
jgi:hypothetical protein